MGKTSQGSSATWGSTLAVELVSVTVSGDGVSLIDVSTLGDDSAQQMVGTVNNPTITVVTLDDTWGSSPSASGLATADNLVIVNGSPTGVTVTYANAALIDYSPSVGVDAAVEHTYTFQTLDNG